MHVCAYFTEILLNVNFIILKKYRKQKWKFRRGGNYVCLKGDKTCNLIQDLSWYFGNQGFDGEFCEDLSLVEYMTLKKFAKQKI